MAKTYKTWESMTPKERRKEQKRNIMFMNERERAKELSFKTFRKQSCVYLTELDAFTLRMDRGYSL